MAPAKEKEAEKKMIDIDELKKKIAERKGEASHVNTILYCASCNFEKENASATCANECPNCQAKQLFWVSYRDGEQHEARRVINAKRGLDDPQLLAAGTEDEATVEEYVGALAVKIIRHATIRQQVKIKLPNGAQKQMMVDVLLPEALNHVLTVIFSGKEVNDETLRWKPSAIVTQPKPKLIVP